MITANENPKLSRVPKRLSPLQSLFVDAYFECNGSINCISKMIDRSEPHCHNIKNTDVVEKNIQERKINKVNKVSPKILSLVTKTDRVDLLWSMAKRGAELIFDKEGNQVMMNPATSVSAIRTINEMLPGSLAPKEVDVNVTVEDRRTEAEIATNIATLMGKYNELKNITDDQVAESRALPDIVIDNDDDDA